MVLTDVGLDHADAPQVLLDHAVELIVNTEDLFKNGMDMGCNIEKHKAHQDNAYQEHQRQGGLQQEGHDQRADHHDRRTHADTHQHLIGVLHVGDVGGQTGDDTGGGKLVDVGERILLHLVVHIVAQIACKTGRSHRRKMAGTAAEDQRQNGADGQQHAVIPDGGHASPINTFVHQIGNQHRNNDLHHHFQRDEQRGQQRLLLKLTDAFR